MEAFNQASFGWLEHCGKNNRNRLGRRLGRPRRRRSNRNDHCHLSVDEIGRQNGKLIVLTVRPAEFDS